MTDMIQNQARSKRSRRARQLRKALRDTVAMFAAVYRDAVRG